MEPTSDTKEKLGALDGLRGFACLLVIVSHVGYTGLIPVISGIGGYGVMIFYALSGFLMAYHYFPETNTIRYWATFLVHRLIRVYPAFFFATLIYLLIASYVHIGVFGDTSPMSLMMRCWSLQSCPDFFWTIPVEIKFYLIYPLVACVIGVTLRRFSVGPVMVFGVPMATASVFASSIIGSPALPLFLFGVLAGVYFSNSYRTQKRSVISYRWIHVSSIAVIAGLAGLIIWSAFTPLPFTQYWNRAWYLAPFIALIVYQVAWIKGPISRVLSHVAMRWIGTISFSLYLMHKAAIYVVMSMLPGQFRSLPILLLTIVIASVAYYYGVEKPFILVAKRTSKALQRVYMKEKTASKN